MTERYSSTVDVLNLNAQERTADLRIVPYGTKIRRGGRMLGFSRVDVREGERLRVNVDHGTGLLSTIGVLESHSQRDDGVYGTMRFLDTAAGRDAYEIVANGVGDVSGEVELTDVEVDDSGDVPVHTATGSLLGLALVTQGAFGASDPASKVLEVYTATDSNDRDGRVESMDDNNNTDTQVESLTADDVREILDLSTIEDELRDIRAKLGAEPAHNRREIAAHEWFAAQLLAEAANDPAPLRNLIEQFALDGTTGTTGGSGDASGLMPQDWWSGGLVDVRGGWRPLFDRLGSMPFPSRGSSIGYPVISSGPTVDERSAQDGAAATDPLVVTTGSAGVQWFDGALRISMELIEQSDPAVMAIVWGRLLSKLSAKIETYAVTTAVAAATAQGGALDFTTQASFVTDLVTTSGLIRVATDEPGNLVALPTADWINYLTLVDASDRRIAATMGSGASDGATPLTAEQASFGGFTLFHCPGLTEALQYNTAALKGTDRGPRRLQNIDVELMGVNVGILGAAVVAPVIAGGIYSYEAP